MTGHVGDLSLRSTNVSRVLHHSREVLAKYNEMMVLAKIGANQSQIASDGNIANKDLLYDMKVTWSSL